MRNRNFYFFCICILSTLTFLIELFPMDTGSGLSSSNSPKLETLENDLMAFRDDLDLFSYAVKVVDNKSSYAVDTREIEFIKSLIKEKKFYNKFREKIKNYAKRFKWLRDGNNLSLSIDDKNEILEISCKIQRRYNKWEKEDKKRKQEKFKIEIEFEKANIEYADVKFEFAAAKKKYEQALIDVKKEAVELKRKEESKKIEIEFERQNKKLAKAEAKFEEAKKKYKQALIDLNR
jgi:hypothetical protein